MGMALLHGGGVGAGAGAQRAKKREVKTSLRDYKIQVRGVRFTPRGSEKGSYVEKSILIKIKN